MNFSRRVRIQLVVFVVVSVVAVTVMAVRYIRLPELLFGAGHYQVTIELPEAAGLYRRGNVTYRGTEVGQVKDVHLTDTGVEAVLSLRSDIKIPSALKAEVHSQTAIGEQFVALLPTDGRSPPLKNGDVISRDHTTVPPDINSLLDATNRGLEAIPRDNLTTAVDEAYTAVGGLGPELSRLVRGANALAIDANANLDSLTTLVDQAKPVLDTQVDTASSIQGWAAHLATITHQLQANDAAVQGILRNGPGTADEARALIERLQPTLPILLTNLVSLGQVAVTYRDNIEQLLVLLPQGTAMMQGGGLADQDMPPKYRGAYLSFNLNLNLPPPCTTGFLPAQQQRVASDVDSPPRPPGDLYCRTPQDAMFNVRGARNTPCVTRPGKRAPTVKLCESDENYVPLNDGYNWKGDPNATTSGQAVPQLPPGTPSAPAVIPPAVPPPIAVAEYDPTTGSYMGPDGRVYTQADLAQSPGTKTWQSMLLPPGQP